MARYEDIALGIARIRRLFLGAGLGIEIDPIGGLAVGEKIAAGSVAATASASLNTGLATVGKVLVSSEAGLAADANTCVLATGKPGVAAGYVTLKRWKHTNSTTNTLVAATTAGTLDWIAVGT